MWSPEWHCPSHGESPPTRRVKRELSKAEQDVGRTDRVPSGWGVLYQQPSLDLPALWKPESSLSVPANLRLVSLTFISKMPEQHGKLRLHPIDQSFPKSFPLIAGPLSPFLKKKNLHSKSSLRILPSKASPVGTLV